MKYPIPCDDDETSIEQYEDVVAYTMEGDFFGVRLPVAFCRRHAVGQGKPAGFQESAQG